MRYCVAKSFNWLVYSVLLLLCQFSFSVNYTVDRGGGVLTDGAGNTGSLAYVLEQMRGSLGPHTVNFTFVGTITHAGGPPATDLINGWKAVWAVSVNNTGAAVTAANTVTFNGNGVTLDWSDYPSTNGVGYGVNVLQVFGPYVTLNDMNFVNASDGTQVSADGTINYTGLGAGVVIADADAIPLATPFTDITFNNCDFTDNGGAGVYNSTYACGAACWPPGSTGNTVGVERVFLNECTALRNGLSGVQFSHADVVEVRGGDFSFNGDHGVFFTGQTYIGDALIAANDLPNSVGVTNGLLTDGATQITTSNNGNGGVVIEGNSTDNIIDDVESSLNQEHGLWLRLASSDNTIRNCESHDNGGGTLSCGINISLGGNANNLIQNNQCYNNQDFGVYLYDNYGLPNDNNEIRDNEVYNNGNHGVYILNSTRTWVRSNTVYSNGTGGNGDGINFGNSSSNGEISDNEVYANNNNGINITEGALIPADAFDANTVAIAAAGSNSNEVFNNYVGILKDGTSNGNTDNGILIQNSFGNRVGTVGRNYVSSNGGHGISLDRIPDGPNSYIQNNFVGTDLTGQTDRGNGFNGIFLTQCEDVLIDSNLVSGNGEDGIQLGDGVSAAAADAVTIISNIIGLDSTGMNSIPNDQHGINVDLSDYVYIGAGDFANRNTISSNGQDGINISNDAGFVNVDFNFVGFTIDGSIARGNGNIGINMTGANNNQILSNYVGNSGNHGVSITSAATASNTIQNNVIGLFYTGAVVPAGNAFNDGDGIHMEDCTDNTIGGTLATGNIIGYNTANGVNVGVTSNLNTISGNYIGINTDSSPIPNAGNGVVIDGTSFDNQIGGQWNADEGNYISNNALNGIFINANNTQTNNTIQGNTVGLDIARTGDFPNGIDGIRIEQGRGNTIGGDRGNFEGNFIAGSHVYQVHLLDGASFNNVYGNSIGNNDGVGTLVFDSGINAVMVEDGSQFNKIGGAGDSLNIIAHDTNAAVVIRGASNFNFVSNNYFGLSYDQDTELGNIDTAIAIYNSSNSFIGTDNPNVVPTSEYHAIYVTGGANSTGTIIENNLIGWEPAGGSQDNIGIGQHGIFVDGAQSSNVSNNQISNILNDHNAVYMEGVAGGAVNTIYANQITTGNNALTGHGIRVLDMSGGSLLVDSNYVDQADSTGIQLHNVTVSATAFENILTSNSLSGLEASNATDLNIDANWVGTDATDADLGNTLSGIWIHNTLGANTVTIENNLVNYNDIYGIHIDGELGGASFINTNFVGVQSDEVTAAGNDNNGIHVNDVTVVLTIGTANVIGGNSGHGINLNNTSNAVITENYIGVSFTNGGADTTDLGNTANGVNIENGSSDNVVGSAFANTAAGLTNFIAYNPIAVNVDGAAADNNTITQNSMFCNDNGDLGGIIHSNDGNNNFPAPTVADWDVSVPVIVQGANGNAQMQLPDSIAIADGVRVDVYTHDYVCDNCRQGMIHGFSETVSGGNMAIDLGWAFDTTDARCSSYTMTVTDAAGNTSEFSTCSKCFQSCEPLNAYYDAPSPFVDTIELCLGTGYTLTAHDSVQVTIDNVVWMDALTNTPLVTQTTSGFDYIPAQPVSGDTMSFYFVYYQDLGCVTISDTVTLVYLDAPTFNLNQDTATCETAAVDVVASNTVNAGGGITWFTTGAGTFTNTGLDGTATYTPTTGEIGSNVYVGYQAEGLNPTSSCNLVRDSVSIRIDEQPDVILPADDSVCVGEELNPITATGTLISNLTWSANITSQIDNANVTYTGVTGAGIVNIIATTEANGRCLADDDTISIEVNELPTPTINGITTICGNDISTFNVTTYASSSSYDWSVTNGSIVSANDTARVTFGSSGTSTISVEETDVSGCIGDDVHSVTITPVLAISVALDPASACEGDNIAVEADPGATPDNITYQWFVVDGTTGVATSVSGTNATNTITGSAISPGDDVRVVISSDYVCPDGDATDTANVTPTIHEIPEAYTQDLTLCEGSAGTLTAVDSNGLSSLTYQWYQNNTAINGATSSTLNISNAQSTDAGLYHVVISNNGCPDNSPQQTVLVTEAEVNISGTINNGDYINVGETVSLSAVTNVANNTGYTLTWVPFGEITNQVTYISDDNSPTTLTYIVTATIAGCVDQDDFTFYIIKPINPPNVITPVTDGVGDGVNDDWILDGIETYPDIDIKIFNRWGNIIYKFNGTGQEYSDDPFDGTRNGEPLPVATYYYIIDLKVDNTVFNGHLSIIR